MATLSSLLSARRTLVRQIEALSSQLSEVDAELFSRVGKLAAALEGNDQAQQLPATPVLELDVAKPTPERRAGGHTRTVIMPAVAERLKSAGRPLRTRELLDALTAQGIQVGGKRPIGNLSAMLSTSGLVSNSSNGWWFKEDQNGEGSGASTPEPSFAANAANAVGRQSHP